MPQATIAAHINTRGLVDEFALVSALKLTFPLHYIVFMQTSCHLAHEGDSESFFALSKHLTDPNMYASMLRALSKIAANQIVYKPTPDQVWAKYYEKYHPSDDPESCHESNPSDSSDFDSD
jgi:DNA topoisomerase IA